VQGADGRYAVPDPAMHAAIMRLRSDTSASGMVAGAFSPAATRRGLPLRSAVQHRKVNSNSRISSGPTGRPS
jgi:hypothetical protein